MRACKGCTAGRTPESWGAAHTRGFTLVELMVVMAIVVILFSVAIPSYQMQVRKSHRTEAKTALMDLAGREERLYSTTNNYSSTPSALGYTVTGNTVPFAVGSGYYQVTITNIAAGPPPTFTVTATPLTADQQKDTQCTSFSINQAGTRTATGSSPNSCW